MSSTVNFDHLICATAFEILQANSAEPALRQMALRNLPFDERQILAK
ncbi:hypothetical protein [Terriglobus saanensis]|nr:hypothetical protein [Terriglobus saanensis]